MKKTQLWMVLIALGLLIGFDACKNKPKPIEDKDVVHGYPHVNDSMWTGFPIDSFKTGDSLVRQSLVDRYRGQLVLNVRHQLGMCIQPGNIHFVFGSGKATGVADGTGKRNSGRFDNELLIIVKDSCKKWTGFLACGNGMLSDTSVHFSSSHDYGDGCVIIMQKSEGLFHYWPKTDEWSNKAKELKIAIRHHQGDVVPLNIYDEAVDLEPVLFPGDRINTCTGEVRDANGSIVDYNARIKATKAWRKANHYTPPKK